jgi:hypothetical protein
MNPSLLWIDADRKFGFEDLVFFQGRGTQDFAARAAHIDTIVLGPHASAAFPVELQDFIAPDLTLRKQCDFSDIITASLGRAWVEADPHVVYIENPMSRLIQDPNRAPATDPMGALREFYQRLKEQRAGAKISFSGVDAIRPITFSGEQVLVEPVNHKQWQVLEGILSSAVRRGVEVYTECCEQVLFQVLAARAPEAPLLLISLHDTMNTKMRDDGAIVIERPVADRLPRWVNFGNGGNTEGEVDNEPVTLDAGTLRRLASAWADAFRLEGAERDESIWLNRPYKGAFETRHFGARLRTRQNPAVGAVQVEFLRESLLGHAAVETLQQPGSDWPVVNSMHLKKIATALAWAGHILRTTLATDIPFD